MHRTALKRRLAATLFALSALSAGLLSATAANAHGGHVGDIDITHPFATPTPPGAVNGAAYMVELENTGKTPDTLLKVSSPIAERAELHHMAVDAGGVMRMREVSGVVIAPGTPVRMRPGDGYHVMLIGLKKPVKDGDSFPLTLEFEHAGKTEVKVVVQVPKARAGAGAMGEGAGMEEAGGHRH